MTRIMKGLVLTGVIALCMSGGAVAAKKLTGDDIRDGSLTGKELKKGSINENRLSDGVRAKLNTTVSGSPVQSGPQGPKGDKGDKGAPGLSELEADGPYPGATDLGNLTNQGDNSNDYWLGNSSARQTSWVQCAPGKVALGGGFHLAADAGDAAARKVQVVVSEPATVANGSLVDGTITGDEAMSIRPNAWLVQGFNDGTTDVVVRPWVICAKVAS